MIHDGVVKSSWYTPVYWWDSVFRAVLGPSSFPRRLDSCLDPPALYTRNGTTWAHPMRHDAGLEMMRMLSKARSSLLSRAPFLNFPTSTTKASVQMLPILMQLLAGARTWQQVRWSSFAALASSVEEACSYDCPRHSYSTKPGAKHMRKRRVSPSSACSLSR